VHTEFDLKEIWILLKKTIAVIVSGFVITAGMAFHNVEAQTSNDQAVQKIRSKIYKLGIGPRARVEAKLHDNSKVKGYVSEAGQDSFTITNSNTGSTRALNYADVAEIKKPGSGLSTRSWIILAGVATAGAIVGFTVIKPVVCDGGAGC